VDVTATTPSGALVIIEIKTSQGTVKQHKERYHQKCQNAPVLRNGIPNNEFWRHQLQCGFAMMTTGSAEGYVIVACADGVEHYKVVSTAAERRNFETQQRLSSARASLYDPKTIPWPDGCDNAIMKTMQKKGYDKKILDDPTVLSGKNGLAVVIIVHRHSSYKGSATEKNHKHFVISASKRVFKNTGKSMKVVMPCILSLNAGKWLVTAAGPRIKPVSF
jgi:hypothetical protein